MNNLNLEMGTNSEHVDWFVSLLKHNRTFESKFSLSQINKKLGDASHICCRVPPGLEYKASANPTLMS